MNIGIIYCGYNQVSYISESLKFWNELTLEGHSFTVAVISVPFSEYKTIPTKIDNSHEVIDSMPHGNIGIVIKEPIYIQEKLARVLALNSLKTLRDDLDIIWQVDSDEFYTVDNVKGILGWIESNKALSYSINLKNYIFDGSFYIDKFCPPRINRFPKKIVCFVDDNHVAYDIPNSEYDKISQYLPSLDIPKEVAWVKHLTWLHSTGKLKVEYQLRHFGECGFKWNEAKQELELDTDYFIRHGYPAPKILKD